VAVIQNIFNFYDYMNIFGKKIKMGVKKTQNSMLIKPPFQLTLLIIPEKNSGSILQKGDTLEQEKKGQNF
jgi:hypothetical protein